PGRVPAALDRRQPRARRRPPRGRAPRGLGSPRGAGMSVTGPSAARERLRTVLGLAADAPPARIAQSPSAPDGPEPSRPGVVAPAGSDVPASRRGPDPALATGAGVVLVAGQGRGIDGLVRTGPVDGYHDGLAHRLVRAGLTVLCPEMLSFGRRRF